MCVCVTTETTVSIKNIHEMKYETDNRKNNVNITSVKTLLWYVSYVFMLHKLLALVWQRSLPFYSKCHFHHRMLLNIKDNLRRDGNYIVVGIIITLTLWLCSDSCHSRCVPGQKWPDSKQLLINLSLCYIITKYWIQSFCQLVFFHLGLVLCFYLHLINR